MNTTLHNFGVIQAISIAHFVGDMMEELTFKDLSKFIQFKPENELDAETGMARLIECQKEEFDAHGFGKEYEKAFGVLLCPDITS